MLHLAESMQRNGGASPSSLMKMKLLSYVYMDDPSDFLNERINHVLYIYDTCDIMPPTEFSETVKDIIIKNVRVLHTKVKYIIWRIVGDIAWDFEDLIKSHKQVQTQDDILRFDMEYHIALMKTDCGVE